MYAITHPILEATFAALAPDAADIADVFGAEHARALDYSIADIVECIADGSVF